MTTLGGQTAGKIATDTVEAVQPSTPGTDRIEADVTLRALSAMPRPGRLFVVSGPSGVGKDALLNDLFRCLPGIERSVSATTRASRNGERDGMDYYFLTHAQFEQDIAADRFLEYARYDDQTYGTPRDHVAAMLGAGVDVILKIEVQGAQSVRGKMPDAVLIFILPPSMEELERRLCRRNTDGKDKIAERLRIARTEIIAASQYDYHVVNDDFDTALESLRCIIVAERHRATKRMKDEG